MTKAISAPPLLSATRARLASFISFLRTHPFKSLLILPFILVLAAIPSSTYQPSLKLPLLRAYYQQPPQLPPPPPVPVKDPNAPIPVLSAKGAIIIDPESSSVLFEHNADQLLMPASTTKIMTALVALDTFPLDQVITIDQEEHTIGHTMNLIRGEQITVRDLLYGMLIASGNDAALALALSYPQGGYTGFVAAMNRKAADLHLNHTTYKNVSGVESPGHLTTARDLARLASYALQHDLFAQIVSTPRLVIQSSDGRLTHDLQSTNQLLGMVDGVTGVKTGWTENALECLVISATREGHSIITVVLGSLDRFGESQTLIDWTYQHYTWESIADPS